MVPSRAGDKRPHSCGQAPLPATHTAARGSPARRCRGPTGAARSLLQGRIVEQLLDEVHVGQQHAAAAVALQAQRVQGIPAGGEQAAVGSRQPPAAAVGSPLSSAPATARERSLLSREPPRPFPKPIRAPNFPGTQTIHPRGLQKILPPLAPMCRDGEGSPGRRSLPGLGSQGGVLGTLAASSGSSANTCPSLAPLFFSHLL